MAVLTTNWESAPRVSPTASKVVTPAEAKADDGSSASEPSADAPKPQRATKPMVVYVTAGTSDEGFDKVEKVILADDKVAIGLKAFRTIKMTPEDVANDPLLADKGKDVPRFLFISTDYADVDVVEGGKLSVGGVWTAMKNLARKSFKADFEKNVKEMKDVLGEWDKIAKARSVLDEKEKRDDKPSPADVKKIQKEKEELEAREKKANERRDELMKWEPKEAVV
jgi:hypothetical protein